MSNIENKIKVYDDFHAFCHYMNKNTKLLFFFTNCIFKIFEKQNKISSAHQDCNKNSEKLLQFKTDIFYVNIQKNVIYSCDQS